MKNLFLSSILLLLTICSSCQEPGGIPSQVFSGKWTQFNQYVTIEKGLLVPLNDTNWTPKRPGAITFASGFYWGYDGLKWTQIGSGTDAGSTYFDGRYFGGDGTVNYPWTAKAIAVPLTPSSTADQTGDAGQIAYDDKFIYVKTASGWKRSALSTF